MAVCDIPYINNAPISEGEKDRLSKIHLDIFSKASDSGLFDEVSDRLQTVKAKKDKTDEFLKGINDAYPSEDSSVATLVPINEGSSALNVNVMPLSKEEQVFFSIPAGKAHFVPSEAFNNQLTPSIASQTTLKQVKGVIKNMGVTIQSILDYSKGSNLDLGGVDGVADLTKRIIAIAEGKEGVALTEEMVHVATSILEQTNPKLVTEMISKIERFSIYDRVYKAYKDNKNYQLPNGKPDIRKIKKEAVDKLISEVIINKNANIEQNPELRSETQTSIVEKMWNAILDFFKRQYRKANIEIFETVGKGIMQGAVSNIANTDATGVFFQVGQPNKAVDDIYNKIIDIDNRMILNPQLGSKKRHYTFDGVEVEKSVTEKVKESQNMPDPTPEQKQEWDQKRQWGDEGHKYIANYVKENLIDKDGYRLPVFKNEPVASVLEDEVTEKLRAFAQELINGYKPGTRFIIERMVINERPKGKIASTMDFVAIEPEGTSFKMDIFDWKFMNIKKEHQNDIPWYKKKEWNSQMGEYAQIMYNYGVKSSQLRKARMMPFQANYIAINHGGTLFNKKPTTYHLESIEIGDLNVQNETNMYLLPVPLDTETTGDEGIDALVASLREYHRKLYKYVATPEQQHIKNQRLNELSTAIRALHIKKDFAPLASVGSTFLRNAALSFKKFEQVDYDKLTPAQTEAMLGEMLDIEESAAKFASLSDAYLNHIPRANMTPADLKVLADLDNIAASTRRMMSKAIELFEDFAVYKAYKEGVTLEDSKESILNPEVEVNAVAKTFLEGTKLSPKIVRLVSNLILKTKSMVVDTVIEKMAEYTPLVKALEEEARAKGKEAFELIGTIHNGKPQLISKIDPTFITNVKEARKDKEKQFFLDNIDKDTYKQLSEDAIKERIDEENRRVYPGDELEAETLREIAINKIKRALDLENPRFNGYNDYDFKRIFWQSLKEGENLSKEYKEMSDAARKVWEFYSSLNEHAKKLKYFSPTQNSFTFFPLIEASMIEKLSKSNSIIEASGDILKDLYTVRAEEMYNYSKVDEETGELKKEIPKMFTRSSKDASKLTTDLNKLGVLWIKALADFEGSSNIENTALVLHNVEKSKGRIITANGGIVWEGGKPKVSGTNTVNAGILQTIIDDAIYGLKENLSSIGNVSFSTVVDKAQQGKTEEDKEKVKVSTKKTLDNMNQLIQSLAVGLKLLVAIPNYVGGHMQAMINAGRFYTKGDFEKNNFKVTTGGLSVIQKALLNKIAPLNENIAQEAMRKLGKEQGLASYLKTWSFHDVMMVTNSYPERLLQYANAMSFIDNTMVVDGKLVNIRQYQAKEDLKKYKTMSFTERRALEKTFDDRVNALKEEKSLAKVATIEGNDVVIPGVSKEEIAKYRVAIIEFGRNLSGQMNPHNKADYRRDTILKSFMMFRGWIPKQISLRTLDINKNLELDQWEYGRTRVFMKTVMHLGFKNIANIRDILLGTERGIELLQEMYEAKKNAYYQRTGQELEITEEEFFDLMRVELQNQMKELAMLAGLVGLVLAVKAAEPPEEEGKGAQNRYKFWMKAANKIADELWFYYNPASAASMTRGDIVPALSLMVKVGTFFEQLFKETEGRIIGDEEIIEKSHPSKYFLNLMPVGHQIQNEIMPLFYPEWAKEQGIRVTTERPTR